MTKPAEFTLSSEALRELAVLLADEIEKRTLRSQGLLTVRDVGIYLAMGESWVYRHWRELGGFKLGEGERAPIRFRLEVVEERLRAAREWSFLARSGS